MTDEGMHTLLALLLPAADAAIGDLRDRYDPSAEHGLRAHVTLRFNWFLPHRMSASDHQAVVHLCAGMHPITMMLRRMAELPHVIYLDPEPANNIHTLAARLAEQCPIDDDSPYFYATRDRRCAAPRRAMCESSRSSD